MVRCEPTGRTRCSLRNCNNNRGAWREAEYFCQEGGTSIWWQWYSSTCDCLPWA